VRDNGPITSTEVSLPEGTLLVSETDPGGRITFANAAFVKVSGYTHEELVGSPHNIVRHPHMPKEAFRDLWTTIKTGTPWEGLVKNRAKNGDFYWVRANVTPMVENGELRGFISIRTAPTRAEVTEADRLYAAMRDGRHRGVTLQGGIVVRTNPLARLGRFGSGIVGGAVLAFSIVALSIGASIFAGTMGVTALPRSIALTAVMIAVLLAGTALMRRMRETFRRIETQFAALARGDLGVKIENVPVHELQRISGFTRSLRAKLAYAEEVRLQREAEAEEARAAVVRQMADRIEVTARKAVEDVMATTAEMTRDADAVTAAAGTVADNASRAADASAETLANAQTVETATEQLAASIRDIASRISEAGAVTRATVQENTATQQSIAHLREEVAQIGQIASLIADIAGQTNLLPVCAK
jgi:PAS domain S-box-containing protein